MFGCKEVGRVVFDCLPIRQFEWFRQVAFRKLSVGEPLTGAGDVGESALASASADWRIFFC